MMSRLAGLAKAAVLLTLLICALVVMVRLLPYDRSPEDELRAFLFPEGCAPPCAIGITPGVTTQDEVAALLDGFEARGWVASRFSHDTSVREKYVTWQWNIDQFPLPAMTRVQPRNNFVHFVGSIAYDATIDIDVPFSDFMLLFEEQPVFYFSAGIGYPVAVSSAFVIRPSFGWSKCTGFGNPLLRLNVNMEIDRQDSAYARTTGTYLDRGTMMRWLRVNCRD
jgi:hypothetical protein